MQNKIKQLQEKLNQLTVLIQEIEKELVDNGEWITSEVRSIKAHLANIPEEIEKLANHPLGNK